MKNTNDQTCENKEILERCDDLMVLDEENIIYIDAELEAELDDTSESFESLNALTNGKRSCIFHPRRKELLNKLCDNSGEDL